MDVDLRGRSCLRELEAAVRGADLPHTDGRVSRGEPAEVWGERIEPLLPYRVNDRTRALTGNPDVRFMHCLPALRGCGPRLGRDGPPTIKAVLVATLED
ncbi:hypothetical protein ACIP2Y_16250 [Streptomyces sviceus]|uniref:hypothetical protein n=1 Tax=Streptomyces sviceus TaxID=285530 RepID=UPI0037F69635